MSALAPATCAISGVSFPSSPSIILQPPRSFGSSFKGNGHSLLLAELPSNCRSRNQRIPPEIAKNKQVIAIHFHGETAALASVRLTAPSDKVSLPGKEVAPAALALGTVNSSTIVAPMRDRTLDLRR